jgi:hypothetical protein
MKVRVLYWTCLHLWLEIKKTTKRLWLECL